MFTERRCCFPVDGLYTYCFTFHRLHRRSVTFPADDYRSCLTFHRLHWKKVLLIKRMLYVLSGLQSSSLQEAVTFQADDLRSVWPSIVFTAGSRHFLSGGSTFCLTFHRLHCRKLPLSHRRIYVLFDLPSYSLQEAATFSADDRRSVWPSIVFPAGSCHFLSGWSTFCLTFHRLPCRGVIFWLLQRLRR